VLHLLANGTDIDGDLELKRLRFSIENGDIKLNLRDSDSRTAQGILKDRKFADEEEKKAAKNPLDIFELRGGVV
jgi:hypothetical protein